MDRQALAAGILKTDGTLLLIVAAIHFAATPFALRFVASQSTPEAFAQLKPPFLLSFILLGVLLLPIALSTIYRANFFRRRERWARTICGFNALGVLLLPVVLVSIMPARYFRAIPFLIGTTLVWIVAISMTVPLVIGKRTPEVLVNGLLGPCRQKIPISRLPPTANPDKYVDELLDAYLRVEDADALYAEYVAKGVEFTRGLRNMPWRSREFVVKDCDGRLLAFGSNL